MQRSDFLYWLLVSALAWLCFISHILYIVHPQDGWTAPNAIRIRLKSWELAKKVSIQAGQTAFTLHLPQEKIPIFPQDSILIRITPSSFQVQHHHQVWQTATFELHPAKPFAFQCGKTKGLYHGALSGRFSLDAQGKMVPSILHETSFSNYLAGVISAEMPFSEPEALKAQAILARTYFLRQKAKSRLYDTEDTEGAQVFKGISVQTAAYQAVQETKNLVLKIGSQLAEAVFSASNGGFTASNATIWGTTPKPYLIAQKDSLDQPNEWHWVVAKKDFFTAAQAWRGKPSTTLKWKVQDESGRWQYAYLDADRVLATDLRAKLKTTSGQLRSTRFDMKEEADYFIFKGTGLGHGVGLSQIGARNRARLGHTFSQILNFYFPNTYISPYDAP